MSFLRTHPNGALGLEAVGMTKRFGGMAALDDVTCRVSAGTFHALLGENGAGKSTLVKCVMGYYHADQGQIAVGEQERAIANPKDAHALGVGMVYQHFTLVPGMTVAENLVLSRTHVPAVVDWAAERKALEAFMAGMPFRVPLTVPVSALAAGEKQKLEILKQLYLKNRFLILDEPTSVLTPGEADEVLGLLRRMTREGKLTVLTITHKFREVMAYADEVTVLRRGRFAGTGKVADLTPADMAEMMIGAKEIPKGASRLATPLGEPRIEIAGLKALNDGGLAAVEDLDLTVRAGEIVGIAGVSGNGQRELVEVLAGQRPPAAGEIKVCGERYAATRAEMKRHRLCLLPEEPLRNACVARMSVAENMSFRTFDDPPNARGGWWLNGAAMRGAARELIQLYKVKTPGPDAPIGTLSGGNVQRAVLARELASDVRVLIVANPCFGLDFAAVADIRSQIMQARNRGAAVLLVSEDLDELFELADRILVMFDGHLVHETPTTQADIGVIGQHMAGH
ncbi:ABC transporter ATP-binding protein [Skermanella stibiiresistens SB22]|uniref:ABC transporter ATP-binding protein n=1 Tax=Skermanella stibiiresistens SB22 TaxID=1385369 RepID=W9GXK8_9PROT|nr:ABC transporter ATP-binding protein [Skermanella stibiiresistens]EWY37376.1 ABC transporter ATP-binding protein [Skermanella stibiiresistens SB22]